ncbi:MAG: GAF domain-containing protein [Anaerolineales bacterium]|jgi:PAS domain S-box-containing protein
MKILGKGTKKQDTRASLELLYVISREIAAALDLHTVLQRVLYLSMKNVGAISGSIIVLDESGQPVESAIITGSEYYGETTQQLRITYEKGLAGWVIRNNQAALIPDTSKDERWLHRPDDAEDQTGAKSAVSAPVLAREQLVGVITLVHPKPSFFNDDHLTLVKAIADQAGIAVLNARLYAESQRQARVMTALVESSAAIKESLKLEDVLQRILEQISQALRVEVVSLALIDPGTDELVFRATTGTQSQSVVGIRLTKGQGVAGWVVKENQGVIVPVAKEDPRFSPGVDEILGFETKAIACAPIRSQDQVIGVLEALNPVDEVFDPDALLVLTGIGSFAGTAIRHAQLFEQLEAAHQRYRELFEDSIDPILITDWQGTIMEANRPAEIIISSDRNALREKNIGQLQILDLQKTGENFNKLSPGETISYESNLCTEGGLEIPVQVYAREVNIDGVSYLQWILRDITERKNLDNLRNDLISMIYHDLRSPLANVVSSLDVLESMIPPDSDPTQKSLLEIAIRSTERIQRLTNSLLDIRRLEAGQPLGSRQATSPTNLANDASENVQLIVDNKNQEVSMLVEDGLPDVWVDVDMIRRVLANLLENAVKYTPPGSKIYIGARQEEDQVLMWVQDTGPGIPQSEQKRVFDKFTRLHGQGTQKGLGLGLAFCRLAIEAHGGRIWVESGPESGASFKFLLPTTDVLQA